MRALYKIKYYERHNTWPKQVNTYIGHFSTLIEAINFVRKYFAPGFFNYTTGPRKVGTMFTIDEKGEYDEVSF